MNAIKNIGAWLMGFGGILFSVLFLMIIFGNLSPANVGFTAGSYWGNNTQNVGQNFSTLANAFLGFFGTIGTILGVVAFLSILIGPFVWAYKSFKGIGGESSGFNGGYSG